MADSPHPKNVCTLLQDKLDRVRQDEYSHYPNMQQLRNRPTLLVIDRTYDLIAALIHEFTYQAMVYDLLTIRNDTYSSVLSVRSLFPAHCPGLL